MTGVIAIRRGSAVGALMSDAVRAKVVEIGRRSANVVVQATVDVVVAGTVSVLDIVVVKELEHITGLGELARQAVVDDVAELDGEDNVLFPLMLHDPLQRPGQDLRVVAVLVKEVLGVGNDSDAELVTAAGEAE